MTDEEAVQYAFLAELHELMIKYKADFEIATEEDVKGFDAFINLYGNGYITLGDTEDSITYADVKAAMCKIMLQQNKEASNE